MKNRLFQLKSFIRYWLDAVDEHSLHSPFFFDFYTKTVKADPGDQTLNHIEGLRLKLLSDHRTIEVKDLGSGSAHFKSSARKIGDIARTSLSPRKYSLLYAKIIHRFNCLHLLELGTSLGINTLYLASAKRVKVKTFEGSTALAETAQDLFDGAGAGNIELIIGNIDETLLPCLRETGTIDFAFLDAHHRYEPTLRYFEGLVQKAHQKSVFVMDDIHYSAEMEMAWKEIQGHKLVFATADLYRCGIVFFDPSLNKQHVVLQF